MAHLNCLTCEDKGFTYAKARECGIVCPTCRGNTRNLHKHDNTDLHRIFDPSVPEDMIGTLNEEYGMLYNTFLVGGKPKVYEG